MTTPLPTCPLCGTDPRFSTQGYRCNNHRCGLSYACLSEAEWLCLCRVSSPKPPEPELLPCPFCGSTRVAYSEKECGVLCDHCQAAGPSAGNCSDGLRYWNDRPIPSSTIPPRLAEALREWRAYQKILPRFNQDDALLVAAIDAEPLLNPKT